MPSDRLFGPTLSDLAVARAVDGSSWIEAMLEVESALAQAEAASGLIPRAAAEAIAGACSERYQVEEIGLQAVASANPVLPLVEAVRSRLPEHAAAHLHHGVTSQDILDTAMMLVSRRALDLLLSELAELADQCATMAERYRSTPMVARTLLQQAVPTTLGLKAAGWMMGLNEAIDLLRELRGRRLAVQLGGAAGTMETLGSGGPEVAAELARRLGLVVPPLPWQSNRVRVAQLGATLGMAGGAAAKIALDLLLMAQDEVAEVEQKAPGASSAMPHKRNPVAAIEARAAERLLQPQVLVLLQAVAGEHERSAGAWQAEWTALAECFRLAAGVTVRTRDALNGVQVNEERMRENLERLVRAIGDPGDGTAAATALVDRALAIHRARARPG